MGTVYLAERIDQAFDQQVAIKIVQSTHLKPELTQRFQTERQILANLQHTHIAHLLDGGATEQGVPYLVMEYIDGIPIDEYCDQNRLTIEQRLDLFLQVCNAVHYAHQNLIVHRDLKPSNILVSTDGQAKLLDFGIAKLLEPVPGIKQPAETRTGLRILTPEHAAPEQILGKPITTATDVYSLGVLLYRLLTGLNPYQLDNHRPAELHRVIVETQPNQPSAAVTQASTDPHYPDSIQQRSRNRDSEPKKLQRQIKGDLDNIVLMALKKEPQRRYPSAEQFAEDIRRYQSGMPVQAHRDSWLYRTQRFTRRHPWGVISALVFVLLMVGVTSREILLRNQISTAWAQEQTQRQNAETAQAESEVVSKFLEDMLSSIDPNTAQGKMIGVKDVLDKAAQNLDKADNPIHQQNLVEARIRHTLGSTYHALGHYETAGPHARRALQLRHSELGEEHPDTLKSLNLLAKVHYELRNAQEAESLLQNSLNAHRRLFGAAHPETLAVLNDLGGEYEAQMHFDKAEALYAESLGTGRQVLGSEHPETLDAMKNLGTLRLKQGRLSEAESLLKEALDTQRRVLGVEHPHTQSTMNNLAAVLTRLGRLDEAQVLFTEALALQQKVLGPEHPYTLAIENNLGMVHFMRKQFTEAETLWAGCLAKSRLSLGSEHPDTASVMNNLGGLLFRQDRFSEAVPLIAEVLAIRRQLLDPEHPDLFESIINMADGYRLTNRLDKAERLYSEALARIEKTRSIKYGKRLHLLINFAELKLATDQEDEAESLMKRALAIGEHKPGKKHAELIRNLKSHTSYLRKTDRIQQADALQALFDKLALQAESAPSPSGD